MSAQRVLDAIENLEQVQLLLEQLRDSVADGICDTSNPQAAARSLASLLLRAQTLVGEAIEKIGD